jgi:hypothetical protein
MEIAAAVRTGVQIAAAEMAEFEWRIMDQHACRATRLHVAVLRLMRLRVSHRRTIH